MQREPGGGTPREFAEYVRRENDKHRALVKSLTIKCE
jgi:hypothetical protein